MFIYQEIFYKTDIFKLIIKDSNFGIGLVDGSQNEFKLTLNFS